MVLSTITLDLDDAQARRDLADPYEMHATLMRLADGGASRPLWRLETPCDGSTPYVLVQTDIDPDPTQLRSRGTPYFTTFESQPHRLLDDIRGGEPLRFRLRANPTLKRAGKRYGLVQEDEQLAWIDRTLRTRGASEVVPLVRESARHTLRRHRGGTPIVLHGATFDGTFHAADPAAIRTAVRDGLGHAKGFGFGLLTVAR
jgi:CRISPR system Cascade subunit CasE